MSRNVFLLVFIFLFCGCLVIDSTAKSVQLKEKSGPYVSTLKRIVKCDKPTMPLAKVAKPFGLLEVVAMKNNIVRGNFTVLGKNKNVRVTVQELYYEDGHWQLTFNAQKVSCHNRLVGLLVNFLDITFNKKTCSVPKGSYVFEVDYNNAEHVLSPIREYGVMARQVDVTSEAGPLVCVRLESDVKPYN